MNTRHEDTIAQLVDQSGKAALVGDAARAEQTLNQARGLDPVTLELELARRAWANAAGTPTEVMARRQRVSARLGAVAVAAPERGDVWVQLSDYLRALGNLEGSLKATASGLKRDPVNIELWLRRTRAQVDLRQLDSAARSLRHCVKLAPTHDGVEAMVRQHAVCTKCHALFAAPGAEVCSHCGADGPARGAPVGSVRFSRQSKFDIYFPRVREVVARALDMPERIKVQLTLDTLLKRHLKRSNQQCARVLRAMSEEFGVAFDAPLFNSAVIGFLDILIADLIRAIDPVTDKSIDTNIRRRVLSNA